jgi:hypothetical protein
MHEQRDQDDDRYRDAENEQQQGTMEVTSGFVSGKALRHRGAGPDGGPRDRARGGAGTFGIAAGKAPARLGTVDGR